MKLTNQSQVIRNEEKFLTSDLGDEVIMMNLESGNYVGLNEVGGTIWKHLEKPLTVQSLIDKLMNEYQISRAQCEDDVMEYLNNMFDKEMIVLI